MSRSTISFRSAGLSFSSFSGIRGGGLKAEVFGARSSDFKVAGSKTRFTDLKMADAGGRVAEVVDGLPLPFADFEAGALEPRLTVLGAMAVYSVERDGAGSLLPPHEGSSK